MLEVLDSAPIDQQTLTELVGDLGDFSSLFAEPTPVEIGQRFLRLQLCPEKTALLAVDEIVAIATATITDILPVPHMPSCVLGLYNWRGAMIWLVDLGQQVGFSGILQAGSSTFMAVIVEVSGQTLGLCVSQVHDIESYDPQLIHAPSLEMFSGQFLPFVKGYLTGDRTIVLNLPALLQDPALSIHCR
ncbi:MAG: chemotaxis protein CheW [Timaviella obliquedivisa GSE-PSE-MK23-08B]|jgi:chemotaxis signal transduction protein|nr:chemotaxis protein CheW [Timaviella obliquedivisa GSE-PSE-MK23-08B]